MADTNNNPKIQPLHPVYTVNNIQTRIKILDGVKISYPSWVKLFTLHAKGFEVLSHIDGTPPPAQDAPAFIAWEKIDSIVLQWIYGMLADDLLTRVLVDQSTAYQAWERVKQLFMNNKGSRAVALQHELTNLTLATMPSVEAYCQKIRELADQLSALDFPINDNQRVLHLVRGLPQEYETVASLLNQTLPAWEYACNRLQSEAQLIVAREHNIPTLVVAAAVTSPQPSRDTRHTQPRDNPWRRPPQQRRDFNRNHPGSRSNSRVLQAQSASPHARNYDPMPPQYSMAQSAPYWAPSPYWAPPPCPYPTQNWAPSGWAPQWDSRHNNRRNHNNPPASSDNRSAQAHLAEVDPLEPTQLATAVQALSMESGNDQWYLDTGASSHVI